MLSVLLGRTPRIALIRASAMIGLIAFVDWRVEGDIPLGFLYLFPMMLVGSALKRWQTAVVAGVCTWLTELFDSFAWSPGVGLPRDVLVFAAFFCCGLFVYEVVRSRQIALLHLGRIEAESAARREAEEQLEVLVETSPAAILTTDSEGSILLANDAAHRLFGLASGGLLGRPIRNYLPSLVSVPASGKSSQLFRTVMQCHGRRENGEAFQADVWFSTYATRMGARLAAMIVDTSEDLRAREELSLHQLMAGSRILVGAVSHEVRNICGAIAVVHQNLARDGALASNRDFEALGSLILTLEKIAAMDLRQTANQATAVDLRAVLDEFRIVMEPALRDDGITAHWSIAPELPPVWADRQSLMQVFLNLAKNSERAMLSQPKRELTVTARVECDRVIVRFTDTGCGVSEANRLFRPFQPGAQATGLGLYLSRAFMRSFRGDLRYEPESPGSSFVVDLSPAISSEEKETNEPADTDSTGRRSQLISGEPQQAVAGR